ncbi:hypothetical protein ACFQL4_16025 [Halosimplex aquaticum]
MPTDLSPVDDALADALDDERTRQRETLSLVASENYASEAVLAAQGSVLTNKYAEGSPGERYYGGCEHADAVERLAQERARELFGADHANVQPHSGTQANLAAYQALLDSGDTVLSLSCATAATSATGSPTRWSTSTSTWFTTASIPRPAGSTTTPSPHAPRRPSPT